MQSSCFGDAFKILANYLGYGDIHKSIIRSIHEYKSPLKIKEFLSIHNINLSVEWKSEYTIANFIESNPVFTGIISIPNVSRCLLFINGDFESGTSDERDTDIKGIYISRLKQFNSEKVNVFGEPLCGSCVADAFNEILIENNCKQFSNKDYKLIKKLVESDFQAYKCIDQLKDKRSDIKFKLNKETDFNTVSDYLKSNYVFTGLLCYIDKNHKPIVYILNKGIITYKTDTTERGLTETIDNEEDGLISLSFISCKEQEYIERSMGLIQPNDVNKNYIESDDGQKYYMGLKQPSQPYKNYIESDTGKRYYLGKRNPDQN
jgi:hypothetical protein